MSFVGVLCLVSCQSLLFVQVVCLVYVGSLRPALLSFTFQVQCHYFFSSVTLKLHLNLLFRMSLSIKVELELDF